ncbi:MAG: alpha/beta hydrolase [Alphaproteobacteria bacterium]|nr:alpha/beta hydrolase [Alphaproteobacteria bacterium]MCB9930519.1 alpha/beta hydrolase [Alphaproteobacteria bacterium]
MSESVTIAGVDLRVVERGSGRPLLFLHSGEGLEPQRPWLDALARHYRVIAPNHPGWGGSALPAWMSGVDDLAYLYLDLAAAFEMRDAVIVGNSFGGWVAAEVLVRDASRFGAAVLASPFGCKFGGRTTREIADTHAMDHAKAMAAAWADPARGAVDLTAKPEAELAQIAQGREALALFGWKPYMHNPRLKNWLHRIATPTLLLRGERDGVVGQAYLQNWADRLPNPRLEAIADAGHYPQWEQPEAFAARIAAFAKP